MIELDALRDLRALVLRIQALREHELEPRPISLEEWQAVLKAAAAATTPETFKPSSIAEESPAGRPLRTSAPSCPDCDGPLNMGVTVGQPVAYECPRCEVRRTGPFLKQQKRKAAR